MLIRNGLTANMTPNTLLGGGFISGVPDHLIMIAATSGGFGKLAAMPWGHSHPYAIAMPIKAGGMASFRGVSGEGDASASIAGGKNAQAALSGAGDMTATGALIISMIASLVGSGTITGASAEAFLQLSAALSGSGSVAAAINAIAHAQAALSGAGSTTSTIRATGELASSITVSGDVLTSTNVGPAVWSAVAASNNDVGTMGEKLNDAGSASNPWTEVIESGFTAAQILRLLAAYVAGDATGMDGSAEFTGLDGSTVRIEGTVSGGDRTITGLNVV